MSREIRKGSRVEATIVDLSQSSGERVITGTVIEVLDAQFIVLEDLPEDHRTHYPFDSGYRFVMNRGEWRKLP